MSLNVYRHPRRPYGRRNSTAHLARVLRLQIGLPDAQSLAARGQKVGGILLLEQLFPWTVGKLAKGMTADAARRKRCWCTDRACVVDQCMAWRWDRGKHNWRHYLIHYRGRCSGLPDAPGVKRAGGSKVLRLVSQ
jgi:hypothetical protein